MNNRNEQSNRVVTFTTAIRLLREADRGMQDSLVGNYRSIIAAANSDNKIIIFVDCDEAADRNTGIVRVQLFESVRLLKKAGGKIYAITSHGLDYFRNGNTRNFTRIYHTLDINRKSTVILNILNQEEDAGRKLFVFGSGDLLALILSAARPGDVLADVSGTQIMEDDDDEPLLSMMQTYSIVEYILFYLATKLFLRRMETERRP